MVSIVTAVLIALVLCAVGSAATYAIVTARSKTAVIAAQLAVTEAEAKSQAADLSLDARVKELQLKAREDAQREAERLRENIEKETADRRNEARDAERRVRDRESNLDKRAKGLDGREKAIESREAEVQSRIADADKLVEKQRGELERVAQLPVAEAREILLKRVEEESRNEMSRVVRRIEEEMREDAEGRARKVLALTMQRCAVDQTSETSVSVVALPSDELKGRIIGREGRNIRAFEQLSGTDLIIDDTPEAVVVSCFEPMRREIARLALSNLVNDGRIHPARIEEMLNKARTDVQQKMREAAEKATTEAHVRLPKPVMEVFGRLLYRTSYGQNMLQHSVEVATFAGIIAAEIGADAVVARRAGLLHDIGKALDHEYEGTHIELGNDLLKRHRESDHVIRAAMEHHMDIGAMTCVESVIVQMADAISSSRPGARRENVETYIKRLQNLEAIAESFEGVEKSFAIQAGREVRIIVRPDKVDDLLALRLARDVAQRIQDEMTYPGEIKITVIRETRSVDYAR